MLILSVKKIITISGNTLKQFIFGVNEHEDRQEYNLYISSEHYNPFYYYGSANQRAQRTLSQGNPNLEPIPFTIPSPEVYDRIRRGDSYWPPGMSKEQRDAFLLVPDYVVTGYTYFGGNFNGSTATITWKEFGTGINISRCTFENSVNIQQFDSKSYIRFSNCKFNGGVRLWNVRATSIFFNNCDFNNSILEFDNCSIEEIVINKCENFSLKISVDRKNEYSQSTPYKITGDIDHKINSMSITDITNAHKITVIGQNIGKIKFKNVNCEEAEFDVRINGLQVINESTEENGNRHLLIKKFQIYAEQITESKVSLLENLHINDLVLTGSLKNSTLIFLGLIIDRILIHDFINDGKLRYNDVRLSEGGEGEILRSQLSKAEFNYIDFSKANKFKIYLSNITEIVINNTIFPTNIIGKDEDDLHGIREIYRQLKNAAGKQGDRIYELYYEKLEMMAFQKTLVGSNNWNDKIIFWTNKESNDFGQDWIRAGSLLLIICLYLFCAIKLTLTNMHFDQPPTFRHLAQFINFILNPLHKFDDIFSSNYKDIDPIPLGFAEILDALSRLFSGYMLFQILRAFRKYTR